ncbi:MAG TPA: hypothetical protein VLE96_05795, partial [Chlamydiales bacterium]|nr:hypothetical protein [Chlamydiales bacterium]
KINKFIWIGIFLSRFLCGEIPIIPLEFLDLPSYQILRQFNPIEHLPEINLREHPEYFLHRNRTVYLTADQKFAIKIWEEQYPSSPSFLRAVYANFYKEIAKIEGLIFDAGGNCRGYVTPFMTSRTFHRDEWDSHGFLLEKNAFGVNIFSSYEIQPQNYQDLFNQLVKNTLETGFLCSDFCPDNTVRLSREWRITITTIPIRANQIIGNSNSECWIVTMQIPKGCSTSRMTTIFNKNFCAP